jgi:hypothetical protein
MRKGQFAWTGHTGWSDKCRAEDLDFKIYLTLLGKSNCILWATGLFRHCSSRERELTVLLMPFTVAVPEWHHDPRTLLSLSRNTESAAFTN